MFFTYETIFQDRSIFVPNEPERILYDLISTIEVIIKKKNYSN